MTLLVLGLGVSTLAVADPDKPRPARRTGYAPDPPALREARQWILTFRYRAGKVRLLRARRVQLRRPIATPRRMGRYALELMRGPTVVDRLRFDFPLLGADELAGRSRPYDAPPRFETKAVVVHRVMVPDSPRVAWARLVDRATGAVMAVPWPPVRTARRTQPDAAVAWSASSEGGTDACNGEPAPDSSSDDADDPPDGCMPDRCPGVDVVPAPPWRQDGAAEDGPRR
jgi:hypothetical protein